MMHPMPTLMARLPVLSAVAAVCLLSACERYPWDPPKPTTDITRPEHRNHTLAAPAPTPSSGVLTQPIAPLRPGSKPDAEPNALNRPLRGLL